MLEWLEIDTQDSYPMNESVILYDTVSEMVNMGYFGPRDESQYNVYSYDLKECPDHYPTHFARITNFPPSNEELT